MRILPLRSATVLPFREETTAGIELRLQVEFLPETNQARLVLAGAEASILEIRNVPARFPSFSGSSTAEGTAQDVRQGKGFDVIKEIQLSLPRQKVNYWNLEREVPLDRDVILQTDAEEGAEARLLIARVRKLR